MNVVGVRKLHSYYTLSLNELRSLRGIEFEICMIRPIRRYVFTANEWPACKQIYKSILAEKRSSFGEFNLQRLNEVTVKFRPVPQKRAVCRKRRRKINH